MTENFILAIVILIMAAIFGMTGLKMWYVMHQDMNLSKKVNGLSIDMGKIKKALKDGLAPVVPQAGITQAGTEIANVTQDLTLDQFIETMGFDKDELNNPIVRPIAQKIFDQMKAKVTVTDGEEASADIEML